MSNQKKIINESVIWFSSIIIALLAIFIFIMMPFDESSIQNKQAVKIYYVDNISSTHQLLIDRFNQAYLNRIKVIPVNLPFTKFTTNERKEILARSLRSKSDRIDIFAVDVIWVPRFARWGYPLTSLFDDKELSKINNYALESCYYDKRLVALPLYIDVGLMYYRKDILKQLPDFETIEKKLKESITWREFIQLGKRLRYMKHPFYIFPGDSYEGMICSFHETLSLDQGNFIFNRDSLDLNTKEAERGLQLLVDLINKYKLTPAAVTKFDEYKSYLYALNNDAIFLHGWPGFHIHYRNAIEDTTKINNFSIAALPHFKGSKNFAVYGGWNLMISKYSSKKQAAIKFLKFIQQRDNQELLYKAGGYIPINKAIFQDSVFINKNEELKYYSQLLDSGKHRPFRVDYTKISDIMSYFLNLALKKEMSVEEALHKASAKINSKQVFIK